MMCVECSPKPGGRSPRESDRHPNGPRHRTTGGSVSASESAVRAMRIRPRLQLPKPVNERLKDGSILGCRSGGRCPAFSRHRRRYAGRAGPQLKECPRGMVPSPPPKRAMVARNHSAPKRVQKKWMVRAVGLEPTLSLRKNGFSYLPTAFAALGCLPRFGVWTIPSPVPEGSPVLRCCPSSLYTFLDRKLSRSRLGSGSPCYRVPRL